VHHCGVFIATSSVHTYHEICLTSMIHDYEVLLLRIWLLCWRFGLRRGNQEWTWRLQLNTNNKMWTFTECAFFSMRLQFHSISYLILLREFYVKTLQLFIHYILFSPQHPDLQSQVLLFLATPLNSSFVCSNSRVFCSALFS
jgi:hypothetical protein